MHINVHFYLINGLFQIESAFLLNYNWYQTNTLLRPLIIQIINYYLMSSMCINKLLMRNLYSINFIFINVPY